MKITTATVFVFSLFVLVYNTNAGSSPIEFRGYMEFDGERLFSLKSTQGGGSAWVRLGQAFCKGKLVDYNGVSKSVTFSSPEGTFNVKMFETDKFGNPAENYGASSPMDSVALDRREITRRGSIPRVLNSRTYKESVIAKYKGKLVDYNPSKNITPSNLEETFRAKILKADGAEVPVDTYGTSNQWDSVNRRAIIMRGSIPRVPTSRTREEKEAAM